MSVPLNQDQGEYGDQLTSKEEGVERQLRSRAIGDVGEHDPNQGQPCPVVLSH